MADVTISDLIAQAPTTNDVFPFSTAVSPSTYKASLAQIKTALAIPTAVSQLTNDSGYITASSLPTSQQLARAWVNFDGINGSVVAGEFRCNILKNYNIDRVVRTTTGRYTVYFATPAPDARYVVTGACNFNNANNDALTIMSIGSQYTNYCQVVSRGYGSAAGHYNPGSMHVVIHY